MTFKRSDEQLTIKPEHLRITFPARNESLKVGDSAVVCAEDAEFLRDGRVIGKLPLGARVKVSKLTEDYVIGEAVVRGIIQTGSVSRKEVTSAPKTGSK